MDILFSVTRDQIDPPPPPANPFVSLIEYDGMHRRDPSLNRYRLPCFSLVYPSTVVAFKVTGE